MLNSTEHEFYPAINAKMPTIVSRTITIYMSVLSKKNLFFSILVFMSNQNFMLCLVDHENVL